MSCLLSMPRECGEHNSAVFGLKCLQTGLERRRQSTEHDGDIHGNSFVIDRVNYINTSQMMQSLVFIKIY